MIKSFSNKLTNINFFLVLCVVMIHSLCFKFIDANSNILISYIYNILLILLESSIPLFFLISGYLFYRGLDISNLNTKLKKRFKTLIIPYLLWNILFFIYYKIISILPIIGNFADLSFDFSLNHLPYNLLWKGFFHTSWYLRNLIIYTYLSPIIFFVFKKISNVNSDKLRNILLVFLILLSYFLSILSNSQYSNVLYFLPVYILGCCLGFFYKNYYEKSDISINKYKLVISIFTLFIIAVCRYIFSWNNIFLYLERSLSAILLYTILSNLKFIYNEPIKIEKMSFLLIIIHTAIVQVITKILILIFGITPFTSLIYTLIVTFLTVFITYLLYIFIKKYLNKPFSILLGGRL